MKRPYQIELQRAVQEFRRFATVRIPVKFGTDSGADSAHDR